VSVTRAEWERKHQHFEAGWWGTCVNTYGEETKQLAYAKLMGLDPGPWQAGNPWPVYDMSRKSVLDIGGGPVSMLLKCTNLGRAVVVDPCTYPGWVHHRYDTHGVEYVEMPAEDFDADGFVYDEVWIYNVLQHTISPEQIIRSARTVGKRLRIFEWVETESYLGHPHSLQVTDLQDWCGGLGRTVVLDDQYRELEPGGTQDPWRVEQKAWGGAFPE